MKAIWKYVITYEETSYEMPKGAQILSVQIQGKDICVWALVDTAEKKTIRHIEMWGTGMPFNVDKKYSFIGTVQYGWLIFHVFEIIE
jgi:hypothetical protein